MACVALSSLMATIELEFMIPNHRVSLRDEKPLKYVFDKLSSLQDFVDKEYNKGKGGGPIRDLEIKIRDFALKAEDAIEIQLRNILLAKHKEHGELHQTLQEISKEAQELLNIINNTSSINEVESMANDSLPLTRLAEPEDIVMVSNLEFTYLMDKYLLNGSDIEERVISILGVPGVGKTSLCKRVCADERVVSYFDIQAWVTISPEYNVQQVLCHLLQSMRPTIVNEIDMGSTISQLKDQLYKHLKCKRYLIVLDDVCSTMLWDDIHQCFPDDSNGSRILLTTHFYDCVRSPFLPMSFLSSDESWDLFCARLSRCMAPEFEEIGKRLVEECDGLPRAIVMVARRLSKCNYTLKEWKKVEKELVSLGILYTDTQHTSKLTDMYNQLPTPIKVCFLYFAVFPKHFDIQVERLISLWIAEGFVPLEDIAYECLQYLDRRGLGYECLEYLEKRRLVTVYLNACRIHNDMHSFCVREAQKEGLLCAVNTRQCIGWPLEVLANSCRWFSLRSHSLDYHVMFSSNIPRSLFFFHGDSEMLIPFKHLRILHLDQSLLLKGVPFPDLVFLRYISVPQWFEGLDDVISTNSNLQTLIVSGIDESKLGAPTRPFPSKIWELQHLRHLELGDMYMLDLPNMVKENLKTLCYAMPILFRKQVYCRFPNITTLKILYKDVLEPGCSRGSCRNPIIILENFVDLLRLETLSVIVPVGCITLLEQLYFPANLMEVRLSGTNFPAKVLRVIGELPKLKVLKLENAFYGSVWEVAEGGFCELEYLVLEAKNLERWVANASCFQQLNRLGLRCCYFLEEIPPFIAENRELYSIELERCPPSVVTSAKWIQRQKAHRIKIQVIPTIIVDGEIFDIQRDSSRRLGQAG